MKGKTLNSRKRTVRQTVKSNNSKKGLGKTNKELLRQNAFAEYVQKRAYYIWQESGKPQGRDWEIWLKAERDVRSSFDKQ